MIAARISVLAALGSSALLFGCTTDGAPNALASGEAASATESVVAAALPTQVDNFMLTDADYMGHELYRLADAKAVVIVTHMNGCPIVRAMTPALKELRDAYKDKGVEFLMLNSALQDKPETVKAEAAEFGLDIPVLIDANQLVGEQLGVTRTAEVFVIDPKTWKVIYRGPLDDRIDYGGAQKAKVTPFAANALDGLLAGKPTVQHASLSTKGCLIDFPERAKKAQHAQISYAKDVAPILEAKCVGCHQPGSIGPFAMTSYEMVKGFSPMIREVIRTDRMPPWNADPHVGKFQDDKSLTKAEIKTLVHWIEAGAPRGDGADPLAQKERHAADWPLGKPDLILDIPAYKIPASGVVEYQRPFVANPLTEGKWIKASTYKIGARQAVHHYLSGYINEVPAAGSQVNEMRWGAGVGGYAVGAESTYWPTNVGTYLPPGGAVAFQAHYTPYGKDVVEKSQIGLYFYKDDEKPDLMMRSTVVVDNSIVIPPGAARHKETAYVEFPKEALLYSAFPHAHYRGYASDLWVQYPSGEKKLLLAMPRYDFNWQREYTFAEPIKIPAGSRVIANYWYDNSKRNPANPDPSKEIVWGDQSWEEMFYTALRFRWIDETATKQVNYDELMNQTRMVGMMDDNVDGKLQKAELRGRAGEMIGKYWAMLDKNGDAALDKAEMAAAQAMMGRGRRGGGQNAAMPSAEPAPGGR
ncbi:redoxin family protein [Phenylobacterium sp.]|uniref:redoxin family protein n=1 Tax=Phenylobacterium sp. TaxID=1871053 RepID=UPI002FE30CDD